jgi:hypothetical protein
MFLLSVGTLKAGDATAHFKVKHNVKGDKSVAAEQVDEITWKDASGLERSTHFVTKSSKYNPGWLSQFSYDDPPIRCLATTSAVGGLSDISHMEGTGNAGGTKRGKGKGETGAVHAKFSWVFRGANHGIVRAEYDMPYYKKDKLSGKAFHVMRDLFFSAGNDAFVYSLTMDFSKLPKNDCNVDTRSPYLEWGWAGDAFGPYTGFKCGTDSVFYCPDTQAKGAKLTKTIGGNIIPFCWQWDTPKDRLCAIIATRPFTEWPQGSEYWPNDPGHILPAGSWDRDKLEAWKYPYQIGGYGGWDQKITWQVPFNLGYEEIKFGNGLKIKAWPKYSYGVMVLLDRLSRKQNERLVKEGEAIQKVKWTALQGRVLDQAPAGPGREKEMAALAVPGYDPLYRVWRAECAGNHLSLKADLDGAVLTNPVLVFEKYSKSKPPVVTLNGQKLEEGTGFYASVDKKSKKLYVTLLAALKNKAELSF